MCVCLHDKILNAKMSLAATTKLSPVALWVVTLASDFPTTAKDEEQTALFSVVFQKARSNISIKTE